MLSLSQNQTEWSNDAASSRKSDRSSCSASGTTKFIMLQKYLYCLRNNITYYYPGYFSTEHPVFDYKLFIDKAATEVYLPGNDIWIGYDLFRENL